MSRPDPDAIKRQYESVNQRISYACTQAGRGVDEITLVAVSKTFSESHIRVLYDLGHRDFGENLVQELISKSESFQHQPDYSEINWHMIGHLQRNKAREVINVSSLFHALDSLRLAKELDKRAEQAKTQQQCLVQVNISGEDSKYGVAPEDLHPFLSTASGFEHLIIKGLMGMARPARDPESIRPELAKLRELSVTYCGPLGDQASMETLSMGMTQDYEIAIEEGATHLRLGNAIFGERANTNQ
ncbi:MAG: YggS family pyridoxal phosphate-dependent enzyme [Rhodothermia bacterium]|nr:MAG: YggS family pyridoxal phosphate-dependent enzyme [Rhodothermia bacterium]